MTDNPFAWLKLAQKEAARIAQEKPVQQPSYTPKVTLNLPAFHPSAREFTAPATEGQVYWTPLRIARYYHAIQRIPVSGYKLPDWVDEGGLRAAYQYLRETRPGEWPTWEDRLDDPVLKTFVANWKTPPPEAKPQRDIQKERNLARLNQELGQFLTGPIGEWTQYGIDYETWQKLPEWKKWANRIFRSMPGVIGQQAINLGIIGASLAGVPGLAIGGGAGAGLGWLMYKEQERKAAAEAAGVPYTPSPLYYVFTALNWPYEQSQQLLGLMAQIAASVEQPEQYGSLSEVLQNLKAAYQAGEGFYAMLPSAILGDPQNALLAKLLGWPVGGVKKINIASPEDVIWSPPQGQNPMRYALAQLRRKIASGEIEPDEALQWTYENFGFSAEMADLIGGYVLDPLDLIGPIGSKAFAQYGKLTGNEELYHAFAHQPGAPDLLTGARLYRQYLRQLPIEELSQRSRFARWFSGVDRDLKAAETGKAPRRTIIDYMFGQTPVARAAELQRNFVEGMSALLDLEGDDVEGMMRLIHTMADMKPEDAVRAAERPTLKVSVGGKETEIPLPTWFLSVEAQHIPYIIRDAKKRLDDLYDLWKAASDSRLFIQRLAKVLDIDSYTLLSDLYNDRINFDQINARLHDLADSGNRRAYTFIENINQDIQSGRMNNEALKRIAKTFMGADGVPFDGKMFGIMAMNILAEAADRFSVDFFGVRPLGYALRLGNLVKQIQGSLLLNTPTYLLNNTINNLITMAWDGLIGMTSKRTRWSFLSRFGVIPPILRHGISAAEFGGGLDIGEVLEKTGVRTYELGREVRRAMRVHDAIQQTSDLLKRLDKFNVFIKLSERVERWSSEMATVKALKEFWDRAWQPGIGFDRLPPDLRLALDAVEMGLADAVEEAIARGMNKKEIEQRLFQGVGRFDLRDLLNQNDYEILSNIPNLWEDLQRELEQATTPEDVVAATNRAKEKALRHIEEEIRRRAEETADEARKRAEQEGLAGVFDMIDNLIPARYDMWMSHFERMDRAAREAARYTGRQRAAIWRAVMRQADLEWRAFETMESARWLGIFEGLGAERMSADYAMAVQHLSDIHAVWQNFFSERNRLMDEFAGFRPDPDLPPDEQDAMRAQKWQEINEYLNALYTDSVLVEDAYQSALDQILIQRFEQVFGPESANTARNWRESIRNVRRNMVEAMLLYRIGRLPDAIVQDWGVLLDDTLIRRIQTLTNGRPIYVIPFQERDGIQQFFYQQIYQPFLRLMLEESRRTQPRRNPPPQAPAAPEPPPAPPQAPPPEPETPPAPPSAPEPPPAPPPEPQSAPEAPRPEPQAQPAVPEIAARPATAEPEAPFALSEPPARTAVTPAPKPDRETEIWRLIADHKPEYAGVDEQGNFRSDVKLKIIKWLRQYSPEARRRNVKRWQDVTPALIIEAATKEREFKDAQRSLYYALVRYERDYALAANTVLAQGFKDAEGNYYSRSGRKITKPNLGRFTDKEHASRLYNFLVKELEEEIKFRGDEWALDNVLEPIRSAARAGGIYSKEATELATYYLFGVPSLDDLVTRNPEDALPSPNVGKPEPTFEEQVAEANENVTTFEHEPPKPPAFVEQGTLFAEVSPQESLFAPPPAEVIAETAASAVEETPPTPVAPPAPRVTERWNVVTKSGREVNPSPAFAINPLSGSVQPKDVKALSAWLLQEFTEESKVIGDYDLFKDNIEAMWQILEQEDGLSRDTRIRLANYTFGVDDVYDLLKDYARQFSMNKLRYYDPNERWWRNPETGELIGPPVPTYEEDPVTFAHLFNHNVSDEWFESEKKKDVPAWRMTPQEYHETGIQARRRREAIAMIEDAFKAAGLLEAELRDYAGIGKDENVAQWLAYEELGTWRKKKADTPEQKRLKEAILNYLRLREKSFRLPDDPETEIHDSGSHLNLVRRAILEREYVPPRVLVYYRKLYEWIPRFNEPHNLGRANWVIRPDGSVTFYTTTGRAVQPPLKFSGLDRFVLDRYIGDAKRYVFDLAVEEIFRMKAWYATKMLEPYLYRPEQMTDAVFEYAWKMAFGEEFSPYLEKLNEDYAIFKANQESRVSPAQAARENVVQTANAVRKNIEAMHALTPPRETNPEIFREYLYEVFQDRYPDNPEKAHQRAEAVWAVVDRIATNLSSEIGLSREDFYKNFVLTRGGTIMVGNALWRLNEKRTEWYHHKIIRVLEQKMPNRATADQILGMLKGVVKDEEIEWSFLKEYLSFNPNPTKKELIEFLRESAVEVEVLTQSRAFLDEANELLSLSLELREEARAVDRQISALLQQIVPIMRAERPDVETLPSDEIRRVLIERFPEYGELLEKHRKLLEDADRLNSMSERYRGMSMTQYEDWTEPGGDNYREIMFVLKPKNPLSLAKLASIRESAGKALDMPTPNLISRSRLFGRLAFEWTSSQHFATANLLLHLRVKDRKTPDGKRILFVEEIQSDWHQRAAKAGYSEPISELSPEEYEIVKTPSGYEVYHRNQLIKKAISEFDLKPDHTQEELESAYRALIKRLEKTGSRYLNLRPIVTEDTYEDAYYASLKWLNLVVGQGFPHAPFKTTWPDLAAKYLVQHAVQAGYDGIAWTTGLMQSKRYSLSNTADVQVLYWEWVDDRHGYLSHKDSKGNILRPYDKLIEIDELNDLVGEDIATRLINSQNYEEVNGKRMQYIGGDDLMVGLSGMEAFYDNRVVNAFNALLKRYGLRTDKLTVYTTPDQTITTHGFLINDSLRSALSNDTFPLFRRDPKAYLDNIEKVTFRRGQNWIEYAIVFKDKSLPVEAEIVDYEQARLRFGDAFFERMLQEGNFGELSGDDIQLINPNGYIVRNATGATYWLENGRAVIHAFQRADVADVLHEYIHAITPLLPDYDKATIAEWYEQTFGRKPKPNWYEKGDPDVDVFEKLARAFERYLTEGPKGLVGAIADVLRKIRDWMLEIYQSITHRDINIHINEKVRAMFDRWLREDQAPVKATHNTLTPEDEYHLMFTYKEGVGVHRPEFTPEQVQQASRRMDAYREAATTKYKDGRTVKDVMDAYLADGWKLESRKIGTSVKLVLGKGDQYVVLTNKTAINYLKTVLNLGEFRRNYDLDQLIAEKMPSSLRADPKLRERGQKLLEIAEREYRKAEEDYKAERRLDTYRRAEMARIARERAYEKMRHAEILRRIAIAMQNGELLYLNNVNSLQDIEYLDIALLRAMTMRDHAENLNRPSNTALATIDDVNYAEAEHVFILKYPILDAEEAGYKPEVIRRLKPYIERTTVDPEIIELYADIIENFGSTSDKDQIRRYRRGVRLGLTDYDSATRVLSEYLGYVVAGPTKDRVRELEIEIAKRDIPGYFPTPLAVVSKMLEYVPPNVTRILEPSAGKGNIADVLRQSFPNAVIEVAEIHPLLAEILQEKGYTLVANNFFDIQSGNYDAIVMNPPFGNLQEVDHIRHAVELVRPGGVVVTLLPPSALFQDTQKAIAFREWLGNFNYYVEELPDGSFLESDRKTGVKVYLLVIEKPERGSPPESAWPLQRRAAGPILRRVEPGEPVDPRRTFAYGVDPNRRYEFRYRLVELDDLIASHDDNLNPNPAYPQELQPRLRDRAASAMQINKIAAELQPDAILTDFNQLDRGPMIVGPDSVVESGNGRVLALRRARLDHPQKLAAYIARLKERAIEFGFTPEDVAHYRYPVLVRERITDVDRVAFAREANESAAMRMSTVENAMTDARRIPDEAVINLVIGETTTIEQALRAQANAEFVRSFAENLPDSERAAIMDRSGQLSREGLERIKNALFAKVYRGEPGRILAEIFLESPDPVIRNVQSALFSSLPIVARVEAMIANGMRPAEFSITDDIAKATEVLARLRQNEMSVDAYLMQLTLFDPELNERQRTLLRFLDQNARSAKAITNFIKTYYQLVEERVPDPRQIALLEIVPYTPEGLLNLAAEKTNASVNFGGEQLSLLEAVSHGETPTPTRGETIAVEPPPAAAAEAEIPAESAALAEPAPVASAGEGLEEPTPVLEGEETASLPLEAEVPSMPEAEPIEAEAPPAPEVEPIEDPMPAPIGTAEGSAPFPELDLTMEAWLRYIVPTLDQIAQRAFDANRISIPELDRRLDEETAKRLRRYLGRVYSQMTDTKMAAVRYAETKRNAALHDYTARTGFDQVLGLFVPYQFWYTRTALQWALRILNRPSILANFFRLMRMRQRHEEGNGFPERLKGKIAIPLPFLPDWMGGTVYVDPMRQLFPFYQLTQPFRELASERNRINRAAETLIEDWVKNGEADPQEARTAILTHRGALWQRAYTQARSSEDLRFQNPADFVFALVSPSLPLSIAYNWLSGRKDEIGQLPITRFIRTMSVLAGLGGPRGLNPEEALRRGYGLPLIDKFDDYRIDRELASMTAEGLIDPEEAIKAMIDRQGPAYEAAQRRVALQEAVKTLGSFLAADVFPEGEAEARRLQQEYRKAWEAYEAGDEEALERFWDEHPEYEARRAIFQDPEKRLRMFLISQIWEAYGNLGRFEKRVITDALGRDFRELFLDKETRSYDAIRTETLAMWANTLKANVPEKAKAAGVPLEMPDEKVVDLINQYFDEREKRFGPYDQDAEPNPEFSKWQNEWLAKHPVIIPYVIGETNVLYGLPLEIQAYVYRYRYERDQRFPDIFKTQETYFALPREKRRAYLKAHPELKAYWEWRRKKAAEFPRAAPYILGDDSLAEAILDEDVTGGGRSGGSSRSDSAKTHPPYLTSSEIRLFSYALIMQLYAYFYRGEQLMPGAMRELQRIWEMLGKPFGTLEDFLTYVVKPTFVK